MPTYRYHDLADAIQPIDLRSVTPQKKPAKTLLIILALALCVIVIVSLVFVPILLLGSGKSYVNVHGTYPESIGVADYGLCTMSNGTVMVYTVNASQVSGTGTLYSMSFPGTVSSLTGEASLQLNVNLIVDTARSTYVYWLQNVVEFYRTPTNGSVLSVADNVWNSSALMSSINGGNISGVGSVYYDEDEGVWFYAADATLDGASGLYFTFPLQFVSSIDVMIVQGSSSPSVRVGFYVSLNGTLHSYPQDQKVAPVSGLYFDNLTISEPQPVTHAYVYVDNHNFKPSGAYYDAEYVFGGAGNGGTTTFSSLNCTMSLSYMVGGKTVQPRAVYEFGCDTAESVTNLVTNYLGNDKFVVTTGTENLTKCYCLG